MPIICKISKTNQNPNVPMWKENIFFFFQYFTQIQLYVCIYILSFHFRKFRRIWNFWYSNSDLFLSFSTINCEYIEAWNWVALLLMDKKSSSFSYFILLFFNSLFFFSLLNSTFFQDFKFFDTPLEVSTWVSSFFLWIWLISRSSYTC